jgi:hypothetical protein
MKVVPLLQPLNLSWSAKILSDIKPSAHSRFVTIDITTANQVTYPVEAEDIDNIEVLYSSDGTAFSHFIDAEYKKSFEIKQNGFYKAIVMTNGTEITTPLFKVNDIQEQFVYVTPYSVMSKEGNITLKNQVMQTVATGQTISTTDIPSGMYFVFDKRNTYITKFIK